MLIKKDYLSNEDLSVWNFANRVLDRMKNGKGVVYRVSYPWYLPYSSFKKYKYGSEHHGVEIIVNQKHGEDIERIIVTHERNRIVYEFRGYVYIPGGWTDNAEAKTLLHELAKAIISTYKKQVLTA